MKKINAEFIKTFNPCYSGIDNFEKQYPNWEGKLSELLSLDNISYSDKLWLTAKVAPIKILQQWSVECSEIVLENFESVFPDDKRVRNCIETVKLFLEGKATIEEISAAESAAWSAAESAARSAARSAAWSAWSAAESAWSAARSAAWSAARSAARSAAWSAARSAAWSAAESAAEKKQEDLNLSILISLLENEGL